MKEKIKVNKLRNEIAAYLLENMKLPKGVRRHHTISVSPNIESAVIKLETFMLSQVMNIPIITKSSFSTNVEKNIVKTDFIVGELDTYIEQSIKCINEVLKEEVEEA